MRNPTYAIINLDNLKHNYRLIKKTVSDRLVIPIIKADAYNHGASLCAKALAKEGATFFAVSSLYEALTLRNDGINEDILILGYIPMENISSAITNNITTAVYSLEYGKKLNEESKKLGKKSKVHIKVNTGMNRLGFNSEGEALNAILEINKMENIIIEGLFSHFATSDEEDKAFSNQQFNRYIKLVKSLEENNIKIPIKHIANSAAITDLDYTYLDAVRPGIVLYGIYPSEVMGDNEYKPVMTLVSSVGNINIIDKDESVSYGRRFSAKNREKILTIPIGYADGYHRLLSNTGEVLINNSIKGKVVGSVCMDMMMVKVDMDANIKVGDKVEIFGENISVDSVAKKAQTIPYEILCHLNKRVQRLFVEDDKLIAED